MDVNAKNIVRLNLGCGNDIRAGWVNLDHAALPGVDVVHDVEKLPLPFKDASIDSILCGAILGHVEYIPLLKDLHRILRRGGKLSIRVPHFTSAINYIDPTHRKLFSVRTFDFFLKNSLYSSRSYYFDFSFSSIERRRIVFDQKGRYRFFIRHIERIVNKTYRRQMIYEDTFLSRLFPAFNLMVTLVK